MAVFEYKALTQQGKTQKGLLEGDSERQVRQALRDKGLTPLQLKAVDKAVNKAQSKTEGVWLNAVYRLPTCH